MAKPELRDHPKFLRLKRLLAEPTPHVIGYLECLWHRGYQIGSPFIGDALDVEAAAEYQGEPGKFAAAAHEAGLLDPVGDGKFAIHDLYDHAPRYARLRMQRKGHAPAPAGSGAPSRTNVPDSRTNVPHSRTNVPRSRTDVRDPGPNGLACAPKPRAQNPEPRTESPEPRSENPEPKASGEPPKPPAARFVPPTVAEVEAFCRERKNGIDPSRFVDFYASKGWRVGDQPMKDWRACVRTWERRDAAKARDSPDFRELVTDASEEFLRRTGGPS